MMSTELVLLLGIYAFILMGVFIDSEGPFQSSFKHGTPRLAARIERDISIGRGFSQKGTVTEWEEQ